MLQQKMALKVERGNVSRYRIWGDRRMDKPFLRKRWLRLPKALYSREPVLNFVFEA